MKTLQLFFALSFPSQLHFTEYLLLGLCVLMLIVIWGLARIIKKLTLELGERPYSEKW